MTQTPQYTNGTRFAIALTCGLFSSIGMVCSVFLLASIVTKSPATGSLVALVVLYAWAALAVMTVAWVRDERVSMYWSVPGTLAGLGCSILFIPFLPFFLSASILGCYLSYFHLRTKRIDGATVSINP